MSSSGGYPSPQPPPTRGGGEERAISPSPCGRGLGGGGGAGELQSLLSRNPVIAELLARFEEIALPDAWLGGGCLAQTVWNAAAGNDPCHGIRDIDLIYHDPADLSEATEHAHEQRLRAM